MPPGSNSLEASLLQELKPMPKRGSQEIDALVMSAAAAGVPVLRQGDQGRKAVRLIENDQDLRIRSARESTGTS